MNRVFQTEERVILENKRLIRQKYGTRIELRRELPWEIMAEEERLNEALI